MATFFIQLHSTHYTAGDTVSGEVLMAVPASIAGCQGVSLRLTAYECLKWVSPRRIPQPPPSPLHSNAHNAVLPASQPLQHLYHADKIEVSECASEQKSDSGLRPRFVRTANNQFYEVEFHEQRKELVSASVRLLESSKLAAGHYSFPFSFKTFQHWPGTLDFSTEQRKAQVRYHLKACIDPVTPHFDFEGNREVVIVESGQMKKGEFNCQVTSFLCFGKGTTAYSLAWNEDREDSYSTTSKAELIIGIDNSHCSTDIKSITLSLTQSHTVQAGKSIEQVVFTKQISGVRAGEKRTDGKAIVETIDLAKVKGLLATTHGKLVTAQTSLSVNLVFDALCFSCKPVSIPLKLRGVDEKVEVPLVIEKDFKPKKMPACVLNLENSLKYHETGEKFGM